MLQLNIYQDYPSPQSPYKFTVTNSNMLGTWPLFQDAELQEVCQVPMCSNIHLPLWGSVILQHETTKHTLSQWIWIFCKFPLSHKKPKLQVSNLLSNHGIYELEHKCQGPCSHLQTPPKVYGTSYPEVCWWDITCPLRYGKTTKFREQVCPKVCKFMNRNHINPKSATSVTNQESGKCR